MLGLATGSTPKKIYQELIRMHKEEGLSFKNVISFNLDEYYPLAAESIQSYRYFMQENYIGCHGSAPKGISSYGHQAGEYRA